MWEMEWTTTAIIVCNTFKMKNMYIQLGSYCKNRTKLYDQSCILYALSCFCPFGWTDLGGCYSTIADNLSGQVTWMPELLDEPAHLCATFKDAQLRLNSGTLDTETQGPNSHWYRDWKCIHLYLTLEWMGRMSFMLDFHYNSLIFKQL